MMSFDCKNCGLIFNSERSLHAHLKAHDINVAEYYCKYFPRRDLLTGRPLEFKRKDDYFASYFSCREHLDKWLKQTPPEKKAPIILDMLKKRIESKKLFFAPTEIELFFADLPPISEYKKIFGSYSAAAKECGVSPSLTGKLPIEWMQDFSRTKIFVDTREQQPLKFANSQNMKLDTGDYAVGGSDFTNTFVDRKSFDDWCGTLVGNNFERFQREIERCKSQDSFLWVVVDADIKRAKWLTSSSYHKPNLSYITHNMRTLQEKYRGHIQFIFSGGREQSERIIPKLLCLGSKLWNVDMQFFLEEQKN